MLSIGEMTMDKATRILILWFNGKSVNKHAFIEKYELNECLFERDIKTLRNFLMEVYIGSEIVFDRREIHIIYQVGKIINLLVLKLLLYWKYFWEREL